MVLAGAIIIDMLDIEAVKYMYYVEDKSQDEIANKLGVSQWVISNRI
jgi:DNA-binding transcriptional regulator LsrR (DeoR family)